MKSCKQKLEKKTSEHDTTLKSLQDINKRKDVAKSEAMRGLKKYCILMIIVPILR